MLHRGYAFAAPEAASFLNEHFADPQHDPRVLGTRITREVEVTAVLPVPKSDVWRLRWVEADRGTQPGTPMRRTAWEGYVTVRLSPPPTVETVQDNPLGVYVTSIAWTAIAETSSSIADDSTAASDTAHVTGAIP
jgi:type IV secretion system protein VirB5